MKIKTLILSCIGSFALIGTSNAFATKVHLTPYEGSTYLLELSKPSRNETTTNLLKQIAREVKKKGYKNFLLPPRNQMGYSTCYIILSNANPKDIKILAQAYGYRIWNVRAILKGKETEF